MNRLILFLIVALISFRLFADVGNAYRYKATFMLSDSTEISGYFYFTTFNEKFEINKNDFKEYIETYYHFPIRLHKKIKTVEINNYLTVDFAIKEKGIEINKNDIINIELIDEIETVVGSRLREVNESEFNLINPYFIENARIYNESYSINCNLYLLSWSKENDLNEIKNEISEKIEGFLIENNNQSILEFIENKKMELIENEIIIFNYCSPL